MKSNWSKFSLFFLFVIAIIGTTLRALPYFPFPFHYRHLVHAHSHVAFQGWVYTIMMLLITTLYLSKEQIDKGRYSLQFKITIPIIIGILIGFSIQGYGLYSILFSTVFQLLNYWFIYRFFRDTKSSNKTISLRFVKTGLCFGLLSTLAPVAIGILSAKGFADTEPYNAAVYFFLHFQYNGWFLFVMIGLLFKWMEEESFIISHKKAKLFHLLFTLAAIPAYTLSLLGMSFSSFLSIPGIVAASLETIALILFIQLLLPAIKNWSKNKSKWLLFITIVSLLSFSVKTLLQALSVLPYFQLYAFNSRNVIMAYMHLSLIGCISFFYISQIIRLDWLKITLTSKIAMTLLIIGFIGSNMILVISGMGITQLPLSLLGFSASMALGIGMLIPGITKEKA